MESKKRVLESVLAPHNYKNTQVVEKIIIGDNPIKPKKILIIVLAFAIGMILSILVALIIEAFKNQNNNIIFPTSN